MVLVITVQLARSHQEIRSHAKVPIVEMERFYRGTASVLAVLPGKNHTLMVRILPVISALNLLSFASMVAVSSVL